jgi:hypothetical protein
VRWQEEERLEDFKFHKADMLNVELKLEHHLPHHLALRISTRKDMERGRGKNEQVFCTHVRGMGLPLYKGRKPARLGAGEVSTSEQGHRFAAVLAFVS